jgi:uncharacterized surface protein with fasciclin (FAS1) repeats
MKKFFLFFSIPLASVLISCNQSSNQPASQSAAADATTPVGGQEAVKDDVSEKDVVKIAVGSKDHTTLVAALKQAEYVDDLSNAGPFTVFAPTNAAFDKLPKGTVEDLLKPENKEKLRDILEYHVAVGGYRQENLNDGQTINQANLKNITITIKDGKMKVNNTANVLATIPASNGIVYVIDEVLLPPSEK